VILCTNNVDGEHTFKEQGDLLKNWGTGHIIDRQAAR
jgi:hypothetical protein